MCRLWCRYAQKTGKGPAGIKTDTPCSCHYEGTLLDGTVFDSSYKRGKPITFAPRQVIKGWTEAMKLMREGDKWRGRCAVRCRTRAHTANQA